MKIVNEIKIDMLNQSCNEGFARVAVAAFVSHCPLTVEQLSDIKTAVSEAVTNAIVHGYADAAGFITLECRIFENIIHNEPKKQIIEIIISDAGKGINDVEQARQPLFTTQPELERSGMGFTVMETFMDEVAVESSVGRGTKVTLRKHISFVG